MAEAPPETAPPATPPPDGAAAIPTDAAPATDAAAAPTVPAAPGAPAPPAPEAAAAPATTPPPTAAPATTPPGVTPPATTARDKTTRGGEEGGGEESGSRQRRQPQPQPPPPPPAAPAAPAPPPPTPEIDPVQEAVAVANGQIEAKQYDQALANLQGALGRKPGSPSAPQANLLVARIYDRQRRTEAAMAAYDGGEESLPARSGHRRSAVPAGGARAGHEAARSSAGRARLSRLGRQRFRQQLVRAACASVARRDRGSAESEDERRRDWKTGPGVAGHAAAAGRTLPDLAAGRRGAVEAGEPVPGSQAIRSGRRRPDRSRHALPAHAVRRVVGGGRALRKAPEGRHERQAGVQQGSLHVPPLRETHKGKFSNELRIRGSRNRELEKAPDVGMHPRHSRVLEFSSSRPFDLATYAPSVRYRRRYWRYARARHRRARDDRRLGDQRARALCLAPDRLGRAGAGRLVARDARGGRRGPEVSPA